MHRISSLEGKLILFAVILASGMAFLSAAVAYFTIKPVGKKSF